jgi:hypothetical protein
MPDDVYPTQVPFSGDSILFSLLRRIGVVTDRVVGNQLQFSVAPELALE